MDPLIIFTYRNQLILFLVSAFWGPTPAMHCGHHIRMAPERLEPKERERERDGKIVINRCFFMTEERKAERREEGRFSWADRQRAVVSG